MIEDRSSWEPCRVPHFSQEIADTVVKRFKWIFVILVNYLLGKAPFLIQIHILEIAFWKQQIPLITELFSTDRLSCSNICFNTMLYHLQSET